MPGPKFQVGPKGITNVEQCPCPPQANDCCEQSVTLQGQLTGTLHQRYRWVERTTTTKVDVPPMSDADAGNFILASVQALEAAGWRIVAHNRVDTGGGWQVIVTLGYDECIPCAGSGPQAK